MCCLHWVTSVHMLGLPKVSCVVHAEWQAGHRSRADCGLKEEMGSHHSPLGGGGHVKDSGPEEATGQGLFLQL